ncbi:HPr family phosphocarrier protein [Paenibacillus chartarius]|uniref:HPr family phosphocarrier protein n=1 Tax=Paenibacillus chartarius TaxID=747481 RepID=A0ABV6DRT9_9BACL
MSGLNPNAIVDINKTANAYAASIVLKIHNRYIDVKSILGLTLTLTLDMDYELDIHGPDEAEAKRAMADVFRKHGMKVYVLP